MLRYYEYCPKCDGIRSMSVSIALKKVAGPAGTQREILVRNYHCDTCDTYVSSAASDEATENELVGYFEQVPSALR